MLRSELERRASSYNNRASSSYQLQLNDNHYAILEDIKMLRECWHSSNSEDVLDTFESNYNNVADEIIELQSEISIIQQSPLFFKFIEEKKQI